MYRDKHTVDDLLENPHVGILWNGVKYHLKINRSDECLILAPQNGTDSEETELSKETANRFLGDADTPFTTYQ